MKITAKMLKAKNVCKNQLDIFSKEWPQGVDINRKSLVRAIDLGLDIEWFARNFTSTDAISELDKAIHVAWEKYSEAIVPIREKYFKVIAPDLEEYNKNIDSASEQHCKAHTVAADEELYEATTVEYEKLNKATYTTRKKFCEAIAVAHAEYDKSIVSCVLSALESLEEL